MKKILYILSFALLFGATMNAQNDTLLQENFTVIFDVDPSDLGADGVSALPSGSDTIWVNYDADGLSAANGFPQEWFWDSLDFNGTNLGLMVSRSWLDGFLPDNRNWLITPPIQIVDGNAKVFWKSAPYQGPRYMDGYTVLVSTTTNDATAAPHPFTDTIFHAAEMVGFIGDASSTDPDSFAFSGGYVHANYYTDSIYFVDPTEDSTLGTFNLGLLEPFEVSLAAYAGQTIYIAFLHDSEDDNLLEIDDILVTGTAPVVNTKKVALEANFEMYPNPAREFLNISYNLDQSAEVNAEIYDMQGRLVRVFASLSNGAGQHQHQLNIGALASGNYTLILTAEDARIVKKFMKN